MKTALIHHWLVTLRGGERVLETVAELFPSADLFTLVCDRSRIPACLAQHRIQSSFLQALPNATSWYRYYLPLFPLATKHLDVAGYDLIISSDAATVKGVRCDAGAIHICWSRNWSHISASTWSSTLSIRAGVDCLLLGTGPNGESSPNVPYPMSVSWGPSPKGLCCRRCSSVKPSFSQERKTSAWFWRRHRHAKNASLPTAAAEPPKLWTRVLPEFCSRSNRWIRSSMV